MQVGVALLAAAVSWFASPVAARTQTVCTITVNSADEKDAFARHLPAARYEFVELVERGRPDWLASACRQRISCDVLVVSGHYDGNDEFFSDRLEVSEWLSVAELERVACSAACPSLFSRLRQVYLFGCNTLNPVPQSGASSEIVRSLVREGQSPQEARRQLQSLAAAHAESSRDRMRQIFKDVPLIYGFSSTAPLGPIAGATLDRWFRAGGAREIVQSRPSQRLLSHFAPYGMSVAGGMTDTDPHARSRADMCQFADQRLSDATRLAFVHELLHRHIGEARLHLDRIGRLMAGLDEQARRASAVAAVLDDIAGDAAARERFLDYARAADELAVRTRLLDLARSLGWLTADERRTEFTLLLRELLGRPRVGVAELGLACELNRERDLEGALDRHVDPGGAPPGRSQGWPAPSGGSERSERGGTGPAPGRSEAGPAPSGGSERSERGGTSYADDVPHAAVRACLGSAEGHARTLQGLISADEADVKIAQAYLRHRPLTDAAELRRLADAVADMPASAAQVLALETLGRHYLSDPDILDRLTRLFSHTPSSSVQAAIAGILIRADLRSIATERLVRTLRDDRLRPPPARDDVVDALIRRLQP